MNNKLGKIIGLASLAGAAAAGIYYILTKNSEVDDDGEDSRDIKKFFAEEKEKIQPREYVSLKKNEASSENSEATDEDANNEDANKDATSKDAIMAKLDEAAKEQAIKEAEAKDGIGVVKADADKAEEFEFEELETEEDA